MRRTPIGLAVALLAGVLVVTPALAQTPTAPTKPGESPQAPKKTPPNRRPPAKPPANAPKPAPSAPQGTPAPEKAPIGAPSPDEIKVGPYVTRSATFRDWDLKFTVRLNSDSADTGKVISDGKDTKKVPEATPFVFSSLAFVWPSLASTATSESVPETITGRLTFDDIVATETPEEMKAFYHSGTKLVKWTAASRNEQFSTREITFEVVVPTRCYRVAFDEASAMKVEWPKGGWPDEAQSTFAAQKFVDLGIDGAPGQPRVFRAYDDAPVRNYLADILARERISDAKAVPPALLAKVICAGVWEDIQPAGEGLQARVRTRELAGMALQAPSVTIETRRGSPHDLTILTLTLMRKAGLPARLVFGVDISEGGDPEFLRKGTRSGKELRSWIEFALYDEPKKTMNWVPVDIVRMRKSSSRATPIDRPFRYFGTLDDFDRVIPFAMHLVPPTDVEFIEPPGFWGWFMTPKSLPGLTAISYEATATPNRGPDEPRPQDRKKDKKDR